MQEHSFITSPLVMLENTRNFLPRENNAVFFNIGGEITEIGVIENDSLSFFVTFPVGIHDFLRIIQTNIKTYDYDLLYQKEIILKSSEQNETLKHLKEKWFELVIQSLGLFSKHIPNKFIIVTNTKTQLFFVNLLQEYIKQRENEILKNMRIINFDISSLKDIITYKTPVGENNLDLVLEALI